MKKCDSSLIPNNRHTASQSKNLFCKVSWKGWRGLERRGCLLFKEGIPSSPRSSLPQKAPRSNQQERGVAFAVMRSASRS